MLGDSIFLPRDFLFWTSLIVVMGAYGTLTLQVVAFRLLLSVFIGFLFFFIGARIVKDAGSPSLLKLFFTRFYALVLLLLLGLVRIQSSFGGYGKLLAQDWQALSGMFSHGFDGQTPSLVGEPDFTGTDLLSGQGQILSNVVSSGDMLTSGDLSADVPVEFASGSVVTDISSSSTGTLPSEPVATTDDDRLQVPALPTLMDVLIYVMNHYTVPLSVKKDITFLYVTPKNPYYPQFRTAYDMKFIGKNANPSKQVLCQTYMVMKGLLEEWEVSDAFDIPTAYRNAAKAKGLLNGCKRNFYVKNVNL